MGPLSTRAIDELIEQYEEKIAKCAQKLAEQRAEMDGLVAAQDVSIGASAKAIEALLNQQNDKISRSEQKLSELQIEMKGVLNAKEATRGGGGRAKEGTRSRRISATWRQILTFLAAAEESGKSLEEIQHFIESNNLDIKDTAVRSQLSIYSSNDKRYLEALGGGRYRITDEGLVLIL
jgi:hypothetical protein